MRNIISRCCHQVCSRKETSPFICLRDKSEKKTVSASKIALALMLSLSLSACFPAKDRHVPAEIVSGQIAGNTYYVPKIYLTPPFSSIGKDTIYVRLMYPGFHPVLEDPEKLWKEGEWYRNVRVLAQYYNDLESKSFTDVALKSTAWFKATEIVGEEYGLIHQTQPKEATQDLHDVWYEKNKEGKIISYIRCSDKIIEIDVPQCTHVMHLGNFSINTHYDKRLLPEWKSVKQNTLDLLKSFESEEASRFFLSQHLPVQNPSK